MHAKLSALCLTSRFVETLNGVKGQGSCLLFPAGGEKPDRAYKTLIVLLSLLPFLLQAHLAASSSISSHSPSFLFHCTSLNEVLSFFTASRIIAPLKHSFICLRLILSPTTISIFPCRALLSRTFQPEQTQSKMPSTVRTAASALAGAALASAHGYVSNVVINGAYYQGYEITAFPYQADPPTVIGWSSSATDLGFVAPDAFGSPDIICHRDSENAQGYAEVAAGDSIFFQWNTWPDSHKGPVIDYLAPCGSSGCGSVDKTTLEFFKISEAGLVDGSTAHGIYASDELIDNSNGWLTKIPESIAPGDYVLRHEIIALHSGGDANGAQNYPQCFNIRVTGSGTEVPAGVLGTELYKADDAGILFSIYSTVEEYPIPGPALIAGAGAVEIGSSAIASTATATPVGEGGSAPTAAPTSEAPTSAPAPTQAPTSEAPTDAPAPTQAPTSTPAQGGETPAPTSTSTPAPPPVEEEPETPACPARRRKTKCSSKKNSKKTRRNVARS
jgi:lytic cellulose monooxygenase (C1-hydroxylating)